MNLVDWNQLMGRPAFAAGLALGAFAFAPAIASAQHAASETVAVSLTTTDAQIEASAERFQASVTWLADESREGRGLGSEGLEEAGRWLAEQFAAIGLEPAGEDGFFDYFVVSNNPHGDGDEQDGTRAMNVIGVIRADAPETLPGFVMIGAHYDHLGFGGQGSLAPDSHEIHNGADDNASGTAALLEIARHLVTRQSELQRDVFVAAFSAEELGLIGSSNLVRSPPESLDFEQAFAMINLDMVGRLEDDRLQVLGGESAEEWPELVQPYCDAYGVDCVIGGDGFGSSDHASFFAAGIPVLHFFTGAHDQYHRPTDDADLIDSRGGAIISAMAADLTVGIAGREEDLTLVEAAEKPQSQRMAFKVRVGTIPDYAGPPAGKTGLLLSSTRPDSPAERAGLQRDDLIVQIDDVEIKDIQDYMGVLAAASAGDTASFFVERDGERIELSVVYEGIDE